MNYTKIPDYNALITQMRGYANLQQEYGATGIEEVLTKLEQQMKQALEELKNLPIDFAQKEKEPDVLEEILKLRNEGPRKMWDCLEGKEFRDKLEGAFLGRMAGCVLGAPVEFWSVEEMEHWAKYTKDTFPPTNYWSKTKFPYRIRYQKSDYIDYTLEGMNGIPVDDDIAYTLLGLLIVEDYGLDFTTEDVAQAWLKYLPCACTAEEITLRNLKNGVGAREAADIDNPYCQWIGADIRSDAFAYIAPGWPERAAKMAYADAYLSHRRNGIYGEMFFAAAQSAAFVVDHPVKALEIALTEIPKDCMLASDIRWALEVGKTVKDYKEARALVDERFKDMDGAHTNNNACLTIFGLMIGGTDLTKVISETVAMGMDNDCTAATAGSIVGAIAGKSKIEKHWYEPFGNAIAHYFTNVPELQLDDVLNRFQMQAEKVFAKCS